MGVATGLAIAGSLAQGALGARGARAQERAARENAQLYGSRYAETQGQFQPYQQAGTDSLSRLQAVNNGDYTGFMQSPDYLAARDMGLEGVDRQAAARGLLGSGGTDADRIQFAGNLATQNLGNYRNSLMGLVNTGSQMTSNLGQLGLGYTQGQTGMTSQAADARASGYNAWGNAIGSAMGGFGDIVGRGGVGANAKFGKGGI